MDPLQRMADRLTERVQEGDRRSRAMLQVMRLAGCPLSLPEPLRMERYPELNYRNFLKHEARYV